MVQVGGQALCGACWSPQAFALLWPLLSLESPNSEVDETFPFSFVMLQFFRPKLREGWGPEAVVTHQFNMSTGTVPPSLGLIS